MRKNCEEREYGKRCMRLVLALLSECDKDAGDGLSSAVFIFRPAGTSGWLYVKVTLVEQVPFKHLWWENEVIVRNKSLLSTSGWGMAVDWRNKSLLGTCGWGMAVDWRNNF